MRSWHLLLAQVICDLSHMSISSITSSLYLMTGQSSVVSHTPLLVYPLAQVASQRSPSLITLLPASSKDGVLTLLCPFSLLLCGLFVIVLLGVLGRGGFFFRKRRRGLLTFNLRGGLGMPFFTGKYGDFLGLPCCLTFAFVCTLGGGGSGGRGGGGLSITKAGFGLIWGVRRCLDVGIGVGRTAGGWIGWGWR